jgi:hypothetical protein
MSRASRGGKVVPMLSRRLLAAVPLVPAAVAALALPATAPAAYHEARFTATFEANVHSVWDFPKTQMAKDCYRTTFYEGHGSEDWHVASTGVNKVLMTGNGSSTQFHHGNWSATGDHDSTRTGLKAKGEVNRQRTDTTSFGSGSCGTLQLPMMDPPPKKDCGTRLVNYDVILAATGAAVAITPDVLSDGENGVREKIGYDNCVLVTPENVLAGSFPAVTGRLMAKGKPVSGWFGRHATMTAVGKERFEGKEAVGGGDRTATVTVDWKLTFKRVGKAKR